MTSMGNTVPKGAPGFRGATMPWGKPGCVGEKSCGAGATAPALPSASFKSHPAMVRRPRALPKSTSIREPAVRSSRLLISGSAVNSLRPLERPNGGPGGQHLTTDLRIDTSMRDICSTDRRRRAGSPQPRWHRLQLSRSRGDCSGGDDGAFFDVSSGEDSLTPIARGRSSRGCTSFTAAEPAPLLDEEIQEPVHRQDFRNPVPPARPGVPREAPRQANGVYDLIVGWALHLRRDAPLRDEP